MVNKNEDNTANQEVPKIELTQHDLILGMRTVKYVKTICLIAFIVCMMIAIFVFMNVPLDTKMPYDGKYNRSGGGIPMPMALAMALIALVVFWRTGKKPEAHHMGKGSRVATYIVATVMVAGCVYFQFIFAEAILVEGGYLAG